MRTLTAGDLILEPLSADHAEAMFQLLDDAELHRYLDQPPPSSVAQLRERYARLESRRSPDGLEHWLNWVVRGGDEVLGFVQATVLPSGDAWVAYVIGRAHWGRGHAFGASRAMFQHLREAYGVARFLASVEAANARSIRLLERLGFRAATPAELAGHDLSPSERLFVR